MQSSKNLYITIKSLPLNQAVQKNIDVYKNAKEIIERYDIATGKHKKCIYVISSTAQNKKVYYDEVRQPKIR